ncbi:hypothetical protein OV320_0581 [Actinobacteria bacterium OV320]|nr:hypothetical protein OV320_0581 [Actinobacteria bacterium OV320]
MDGYEHLDLDEIDFAPMEHDTERLRLLTLDEAHELIQVLRTTTEEGGSAAQEADRLAREIGALIGYWPRSAQIVPLRPAAVSARCYSLSGDSPHRARLAISGEIQLLQGP